MARDYKKEQEQSKAINKIINLKIPIQLYNDFKGKVEVDSQNVSQAIKELISNYTYKE